MAFSTPEVYEKVSQGRLEVLSKLTPSWMGTEKKSQPVSLAIASPPGTPGR